MLEYIWFIRGICSFLFVSESTWSRSILINKKGSPCHLSVQTLLCAEWGLLKQLLCHSSPLCCRDLVLVEVGWQSSLVVWQPATALVVVERRCQKLKERSLMQPNTEGELDSGFCSRSQPCTWLFFGRLWIFSMHFLFGRTAAKTFQLALCWAGSDVAGFASVDVAQR